MFKSKKAYKITTYSQLRRREHHRLAMGRLYLLLLAAFSLGIGAQLTKIALHYRSSQSNTLKVVNLVDHSATKKVPKYQR